MLQQRACRAVVREAVKYFVSGSSFPRANIKRVAAAVEWRLMSCHANYIGHLDVWMREALALGNDSQEIMLDSGAFTAWNKGEDVGLKHLIRAYASFIKRYERKTKAVWLINLDRIPGRKGGPEPTGEEITAAIHESDENYRALVAEFGARVLPVFHQGEPETRLREVAGMGDYICVSPRNDVPEQSRVRWCRAVHARVKNKTHGLATTGVLMATTIPWHSTDSAAYVIRASLGMVFVDLGDTVRSLNISKDSPARYEAGRHFDSMSKAKQDFLRAKFEARGFTVEELRTKMWSRASFSVLEIIDWNYRKQIVPINEPSLFGV